MQEKYNEIINIEKIWRLSTLYTKAIDRKWLSNIYISLAYIKYDCYIITTGLKYYPKNVLSFSCTGIGWKKNRVYFHWIYTQHTGETKMTQYVLNKKLDIQKQFNTNSNKSRAQMCIVNF